MSNESPGRWHIDWYAGEYRIEYPDHIVTWSQISPDILARMPKVQEHRGWPNFEVVLDKVKAFIRGENSL